MADFDIMPDGAPPEEPEMSAETAYQNIPAPVGQFLGTQIGSTVRQIGRVAQQGMYEGSSGISQWLRSALVTTPEVETNGVPTAPTAGSVPSPMLTPEEYNARYAPNGPDGKPVSLGSGPMPEGVAKLVGDAKREEVERENVAARYENAHSWPTNFAAGTLGFMLDPLRAATAFVPGIGEEAILARLGGGFAARLGARVVAGATAGAAAQAPLSALEYGLGQQEASDYGLRDAFRDIAFAAAGNAILHTGIGTAGELLRGRPAAAPEASAEEPLGFREAAPIMAADAQTQHAALSRAVSELADGRPIQVDPFFPAPRRPPDLIDMLMDRGGVRDAGGELAAMDLNRPQKGRWGILSRAGGMPLDEARTIAEEEGYLPPGSDINDLLEAIRETSQGRPVFRPGEALDWQEYRANERRGGFQEGGFFDPNAMFAKPSPAEIAAQQRALYHDGFAPGVSDADLRMANAEIYEPLPDESELFGETPAQPQEGTAAPSAPEQQESRPAEQPGAEATEADPEIAAAQQRLQAIDQTLLPEERMEIEQAHAAIATAKAKASAIDEAANCLKEAGL